MTVRQIVECEPSGGIGNRETVSRSQIDHHRVQMVGFVLRLQARDLPVNRAPGRNDLQVETRGAARRHRDFFCFSRR